MSLYDRLAQLPLQVEAYELQGLRRVVSSEFERQTTLVVLRGAGQIGMGEDVTYQGVEQERLQAAGAVHELSGVRTLGELSEHVGALDLFGGQPPEMEAARLYRRWAFESAAADLALRQAQRSLADVLGREPRPVRYVVSLRLGEPPSLEPVRRRLDSYPSLRFKLDPTSSWTDELIAQLVATDAVDTVDFKGAYRGTVVDQPADPALYARVAAAFAQAWIEDPDLTSPQTDAVLSPYRARITWDAPIHSVEDIKALAFAPRMVNIKPSRFGSWQALCAAYDYCEAQGIAMYGGGQFELGVGRGQVQYLASLFHPDAPNDVAPSGFNDPTPPPGLPPSPLAPAPTPVGFRWGQ